MTRILAAASLLLAGLASLAAPHAQAAWCQVDYRYVEQTGVGFGCQFPNGLPDCTGHTPGFDLPVPYVRCGGIEVPPAMAPLCAVSVGASLVDDAAVCTTADYVPGTACEAVVDTTDPLATSASC